MKKLKLLMMMATSMLLAFAACEREGEVSVEFVNPAYQMKVGDTLNLAEELKISNSDRKPEWHSSDEAVAVIDAEGVIKALAAGETNVTAMVEGKEASCVVTVSDIAAGKITVEAPKSLEADGAWGNVKASAEAEGYNADNFVWTFTAVPEGLEFETEKVSASEYKVRFKTFAADGKLTVKVADANSDAAQTAEIAVTEKVVPATKITLDMPVELTEGDDVWGSVKVEVTPEDYDPEHLVWEFEPSSADLGFRYEKVSATEYKVQFAAYVEDGSVFVVVSDELSETFNQGRIKVIEKPFEGVIDLKVSPAALALNVGDEPVALQMTVTPADYDLNLLEWTSSDEAVATVADGVVTPVADGEAVITLKDKVSGKEASCTVTVTTPVKEAVVKEIVLSRTALNLRVGEEAVQLTATCYDADGKVVENYAGLVWSADPMPGENGKDVIVVEVSQKGIVTPRNAGTTIVVVTDVDNPQARAVCNVAVLAAEVKVEEVKLLPASKTIEIGTEFTPEIVILPENAENKTLRFTSSDESVATVNAEGTVTGVAPGNVVITATAANGVKGECKVKVAEEYGIYLSETEMTLTVGQEKTLTATVTPEDAENKTVTWTSSDTSVATVENGTVRAVEEGTAVITASANGKSATCEVTVETGIVDFDIDIVPSDQNLMTKGLMQDKTVRLNAYYTKVKDDTEYVPVAVSWSSSDVSIATVDSEGNVTAVIDHIDESGFENGKKVTITHVADHEEKSIEITVVKAMPEQIIMTAVPEVDGVQYKMMHGDSFTFGAKVLPEKARQDVWYAGGEYFQLPDNTFTATSVGNVEFTAYAADNTDVRLKFTVEVLPVVLTDMTLSNTALDMVTGAHASLTVSFTPHNASYKTLEWSSSDETVAVVDANGAVTAVGPGTAVITAFQEENDMTCTCEVTVTDPVVTYNVGDYYYSTGKVSSKPDEDEATYGKVIGVIFSTDNPVQGGDAALAADYPDCVNGYVISTVEYTEQDFGAVSSYNGHGYYAGLGFDANAIVAEDKANGYGNTLAHKGLNASKPDYCLMFNEQEGVIAVHSAAVPAPSSASAWYVPSYKEMQMLVENSAAVNASLTAAGGTPVADPYEVDDALDDNRSSDWYWTSTIFGQWYERGKSYDHFKHPFDISRNGWTSVQQPSGNFRARVILAF